MCGKFMGTSIYIHIYIDMFVFEKKKTPHTLTYSSKSAFLKNNKYFFWYVMLKKAPVN